MLPKNRPPTHPGEMLQEEFLTPLGMSQVTLAGKMGVPVQRINTLINGKRGISPDTALRLGRYFGNSARFWLNLQLNYELSIAERSIGEKIRDEIKPAASAA